MNSLNKMPPEERIEWQKMVSGEISYTYKNYTLQVQLTRLTKKIKAGQLSTKDAVNQLYKLCDKYYLAVEEDLKLIFIKW